MSETIHIPVLASEVIEALSLKSGDTVVDATLGGGGHALRIFDRVSPDGRLFACDADPKAIARFRLRLEQEARYREALEDGRITLLEGRFSEIVETLRMQGVSNVSAIFADLGLSSDQLDDSTRGFSLLREGPLDMRFDQRSGTTAGDIVNSADQETLARIFREYGDIRESGRLARRIVEMRKKKLFETTIELAECIKDVSRNRKSSIHPATTAFQALRMAVNSERDVLEKFLREAIGILEKGGRIAVISFHSGEERMVKRIFQEDARGCVCPREFPICRCGRKARLRILTGKPVVPSEEEYRENPRARSAKLRVAERM